MLWTDSHSNSSSPNHVCADSNIHTPTNTHSDGNSITHTYANTLTNSYPTAAANIPGNRGRVLTEVSCGADRQISASDNGCTSGYEYDSCDI